LDLSAVQMEQALATSRLGLARSHVESSLAQRWLQVVRLGETGALVTCVLPALAIVAINDICYWSYPASPAWVRGLVTIVGLLVVVVAAAPRWMRMMVAARPLAANAPLPVRVAALSRKLRLPCPAVLVVGAQRSWYGAALVGWVRGARELWIGQVVAEELSAAEIDMVILHELAHLKRGHCWWRAVPLVVAGVLLAVLVTILREPFESLELSPGLRSCLAGLGLVAIVGSICAAMGWISRCCELDADRQACTLANSVCDWAQDHPLLAAEKLAQALAKLHGPDARSDRQYWLHPSLAERYRALGQPG